MPTQPLPNNPSLENLRKQAKSLRKAVLANDADALTRAREFHPRLDEAIKKFSLSDAQLVIARGYGFASWSNLKQYLAVLDRHSFMPPAPTVADDSEPIGDRFIRLACLNYLADHTTRRDRARELLAQNPSISRDDIYTATTVGDVAAVQNMPGENRKLANLRGGPYNWEPLLYATYSRLNSDAKEHSTLEVARLLLKHGADPDAGFLWDCHYLFTALTGVFGEGEAGRVHQPEHQYCYQLARLLLEAGADPNTVRRCTTACSRAARGIWNCYSSSAWAQGAMASGSSGLVVYLRRLPRCSYNRCAGPPSTIKWNECGCSSSTAWM